MPMKLNLLGGGKEKIQLIQ